MTGLQVLFTYAPVFNTIFLSHSMGIVHWAMVLGYSALISLITGMEKLARRRRYEARQ